MSNFEPNAVIRGAQLTVVGTVRALINPRLFKYDHFRQAALAIAIGIIIQVVIQIPIISVRLLIWITSWIVDLEDTTWDNNLLNGLDFLNKSVLQVPFLLMTLLRYVVPTLDEIFMDSLNWVDTTYVHKHKTEDPKTLRAMYYPNLVQYPTNDKGESKPIVEKLLAFLKRYGRKVGMLLGIYLVSLVPIVGRFVMPAASFYTFHNAVGTTPAAVIFGTGILLPKRYLVTFLHSYFASRSLMRELLEPYFSRIHFTSEQRRHWFKDREGVLFGFAFAFTFVLKIPIIGVLMYGVAEASTAYLVTKITDPPPSPAESEGFAETQVTWKNKHDFLGLSLDNIDKLNVAAHDQQPAPKPTTPGRRFA
ncbi:transmembrane protein UsgS [Aspergillus mulundensis]|uniref:Putative Transmembrane protein UsgS n=1 Tax=Aspergillus mulundensis TaxID=1810919 RepID=A0A3D8REB2_9EURO|nr:putative Transmembrane protein UsgS [Aspergillus mulundensis]RDW72276.1 putative Transmembrane protein UsgS [Aspergillus mulundensis]